MSRLCCGILVVAVVVQGMPLAGAADPAEAIYETSFANGAADWTGVDRATISEVARRPGGRSLLIAQTKDEEADSAWLSPVIRNPGASVRVGFWVVDNYSVQQDPSYAAAIEVVPCDKEGTPTTAGGDWTNLPWDDARQIPTYKHTLTRAGLRWRHHEVVKRPGGEYFRVRFFWPKALARGECYLTDLRVTAAEADPTPAAAAAPSTAAGRHALEISTAANANLFFADDPLRFDFLLSARDGKPVGDLRQPVLRYDITDYEHFFVASGTLSFADARPVTDKALQTLRSGDRSQNLRLSAEVSDPAAKEIGREFFVHAVLLDGDTVLGEDTVTYAVVNPRPIAPKDHAKCRFTAFSTGGGLRDAGSKHERQGLIDKMGITLTQTWDYGGWKAAQPVKDGPIVVTPGPDLPTMVYCPNLEQIRGRKPGHAWGDMATMAPAWAVIDDSFYPGCQTFDIDGYVAYILAYVRANRHNVVMVVPSGLERPIDARTMELQGKAYAALKREFPDLPVGMSTMGVQENPEVVKQILDDRLYAIADFFDTHVYGAGLNAPELMRLKRELRKLGLERPVVSTELAYVGGNDQIQGSRDLVKTALDAHARGMDRITDYLTYTSVKQPVLRGEFPGEGFAWMQYADRPKVADAVRDDGWSGGGGGRDRRGASLMPLLKTTAFYNLVQAVECADFKLAFKPTERTIAYVYARDGRTICYLFLSEPNPAVTLALDTDVPYTMQDLYGRTDRVAPRGASLVCATLDPLLLTFEGEVPALHDAATAGTVLKAVTGGLTLPAIARGSSGRATLTVPPVFTQSFEARVVATVDGTWPQVETRTFKASADTSGTVELPITVAAERSAGVVTFTTRLYDGDTLVTVLKQPLQVGELLTARLSAVPMTKTQDPAVLVTVRSLGDEPMSGTIRVENRFFGEGFEPAAMERAYTVQPGGVAEVRFPVPRTQVNLSTSYEMRASVTDASGFTISCTDDVSFQACEKSRTPITVDGDLSDWNLDELMPIPFEKCFPPGERDAREFSGQFHTRWDEQKLYFAAVFNDSTPVATGAKQVRWTDDNIMVSLYPWTWHMGDPLDSGYYREHVGPLQDGKAGILRAACVAGGPGTAEGAEIAVTRTATGWVYEWAYPKACLHPLALETGSGFRLSMSAVDQTKMDKKGEDDWGRMTWLTFSGFNTNVNARPDLWRQFLLVDERGPR